MGITLRCGYRIFSPCLPCLNTVTHAATNSGELKTLFASCCDSPDTPISASHHDVRRILNCGIRHPMWIDTTPVPQIFPLNFFSYRQICLIWNIDVIHKIRNILVPVQYPITMFRPAIRIVLC